MSYQSQLAMLDEKAVEATSETGSTQTCTICGATPRQMNRLEVSRRPVTNTTLGICVLLCWIRMFEALLRFASLLQLQSRVASGLENQEAVKTEEKKTQARIKEKLGVNEQRVNEARSGGVGNCNDRTCI